MLKKMIIAGLLMLIMLLCMGGTVFGAVNGSTSEGWIIFDPYTTGENYRYGPSIIINEDNSVDMWFSSPGTIPGAWDSIRYRHYTGMPANTYTESVALEPTAGSYDLLSACDPGVIKIGSYYYIGYTTTTDTRGTNNNICIARSTSPGGTYEKWNGSGWGGNPAPFITYTGPSECYGAGEPGFVLKDGTLYIYYSWIAKDTNGNLLNQTRVATVDNPAANSNWPASLTYRGVAINRSWGKNWYYDEDSTDIKYIDAYGKFFGVSTARKGSKESYVNAYESTDGIVFTPANVPNNFIQKYCHNIGISGTAEGHLDITRNNFISYCYGWIWGEWYTYVNPISFTNNGLPPVPEVYTVHPDNGSVDIHFETVSGVNYKIKYGTSSGAYTTTVTGITSSPYTISGLTNGNTYYFVVIASNANGDSVDSLQLNATPLNYSTSPCTVVTASSQLSGMGLNASNAVDSDVNTFWSSNPHSSSSNNEWICVDTGGNKAIKRITLTPRQYALMCYPAGFTIQVSKDGTNWYNADYEFDTYALRDDCVRNVYTFRKPLWGRYVRVNATSINCDENNNYYFQLAEINIEEIPYALTSSTYSWYDATNALDASSTTFWNANTSSASCTEWLCVDQGISTTVTGIRLDPRDADQTCFPVDFKFQYSSDGANWSDVPGQSYTNYTAPPNRTQSFKFGSPINTRFIRLYVTKVRLAGNGYYYCQISEIYVDSDLKCSATASSSISGWAAGNAVDGNRSYCWSSNAHSTANSTEWICVDLGETKGVSGIKLAPRPGYCFPADFSVEYSNYGNIWTIVPGQVYHDYYNASNPSTGETQIQILQFSSVVNARYIRITATKLRQDDSGVNYHFQLGEIYVDR